MEEKQGIKLDILANSVNKISMKIWQRQERLKIDLKLYGVILNISKFNLAFLFVDLCNVPYETFKLNSKTTNFIAIMAYNIQKSRFEIKREGLAKNEFEMIKLSNFSSPKCFFLFLTFRKLS